MLKMLKPDKGFIDNTLSYSKTDLLLALLLCCFQGLIYWCLGSLFVHKAMSLTETYKIIATGIASGVIVCLALLFCKIRKQQINTLGFNKTYAVRSLLAGFALSAVWSVIFILTKIRTGIILQSNAGLILLRIVYYMFFIALMEEITCRAYIGSRLYGFFKHKVISVLVTGFLFALLHIPFYMAMAQMNFWEFLRSGLWGYNFFGLIFWHVIHYWLYVRYNNILGPTLFHFTIDFLPWLFI